jgi:uncharacterized protein (TIRG00374 family)
MTSAAPRAARAASPRRWLDWRALVGILISAVLLYFAFRGEDLGAVIREILSADPIMFILATAAATFVFWIRAWRWRSLLEPVQPGTKFRSRFAAVTIGFMGNNLLPARIGEFARAYAFSRMEPVSIMASFSTLVVERLFDALFLVGFLFLAMTLPDFPSFAQASGSSWAAGARTLGALAAVAFLVLFALALWPRRTVVLLEASVVRILPRRVRRPVIDALEAFVAGAGVLRNPHLMMRAAAWSALLWLTNAFSFWLAFRAFELHLSFTAAMFLQSCVALAVSVPSGPGFFGPFEAATKWVLALWGQAETKALGFALGFHIAGFIPVTLMGLYYAWRLGLSLSSVAHTEETVEDAVEQETGVDPDRPAH